MVFHSVTKSKQRVEAYKKVNGETIFANDLEMKDMQYAYGVSSKYAFAWVKNIDTSQAEQAPGVSCVITYQDIPGDVLMGEDKQDQYVLAVDRVITVGDILAVVVADTMEHAKQAGQLVKIEYEKLHELTDLEEAYRSDMVVNPYRNDNLCSQCFIKKGNIDNAFGPENVSVQTHYETTWQEHAYIEPECVVAYPGRRNREVTVIGSMQSIYNPRMSIHKSLQIPLADIRIVATSVGGSFGGKLESPEVMAVRAAACALKCHKPVKYLLTREESMQQSHKRHPFKFDVHVSADQEGKLQGFEALAMTDSGAYANMSPGVAFKAVSLGAGPYVVPNVYCGAKAIYTNNIPSGSMRGFGNPQGIFARECALDELAEKLGMSPYLLRKRNVMHRGDATGSGQIIDFEDIGAEEVLDQVAQKLDYEKKYWQYKKENPGKTKRRGVGLSLTYRGNSYGTGVPDVGRCYLEVQMDGSVRLNIGLTEIGQGLHTVMGQIAAEALMVSDDQVTVSESTTDAPATGICNASRGTFVGGNAILDAAKKIHECMRDALSETFQCDRRKIRFLLDMVDVDGKKISFKEAAGITFSTGRTPAFTGNYKTPDPVFDEKTGFGDTFYEYTYSCIGAEVEIDTCTGETTVLNVVSAHDAGRIMNPKLAAGQIVGGAVMAQGYALMEDINSVKGYAKNENFDQYMIPGIKDVGRVLPVTVENPNDRGPFGARSLGEPTLDPGLGAFTNAVNHALGELGKVKSSPASLEKVLFSCGGAKGDGR